MSKLSIPDALRAQTLGLATAPGSATAADHGSLLGLADDDHSQYVHISITRVITAQHQFAPSAPQAPFTLGANAQGQLVTGLYADQLSKSVIAGSGLTGGGVLTADRTLNVGAGDGIDVAADAVSVDVTDIIDTNYGLTESANDIRLNVGAAFTFATGALALASGVAGAGLTLTSQILAVGAGDGIDVAADSVAVDVTDFIDTNYGLTENTNNIRVDLGTGLTFAAGQVVLAWSGTPGNITPDAAAAGGASSYAARVDHAHGAECAAPAANLNHSSSNAEGDATSFSRSNHVHGLDASADVGTAPAASLLKSTLGGGLILGTLGVKGNVDITNGGDLTVGANIFFVDASQGNIGINCAPDLQFDLDIAGNLRAQGWIVGKHAIQLDGALMICHYDGDIPIQTDFSGNATGHMGQPAALRGGAIFREGFVGKAVQIAEATTNINYNPLFEGTYTAGVAPSVSVANTGGTLTLSENANLRYCKLGGQSQKVILTGSATDYVYLDHAAMANSTTYSWQLTFYLAAGEITVRCYKGTTATSQNYNTTGWHTFKNSEATDGAGAQFTFLIFSTTGGTVYLDSAQIEAKAYCTPVAAGSLGGYSATGVANGTGHAWTGAAYASTSTRLLSECYYTSPLIETEGAGSVMFYFKVGQRTGTDHAWLFSDTGRRIELIQRADTSVLSLVIDGTSRAIAGAAAVSWDVWHHVAVVWDGTNTTVYLDGAAYGSVAYSPTSLGATFYVGTLGTSGGVLNANGWIDEMGLFNRALEADEITAVYESEAPVFAETSTWSWRSANNLVWADSEGLWMRDEDGVAVLGVCGVDGKSWGGLTLNKGDHLLGYYGASDGGWVYFDRDGINSDGLLSIGYSDQTIMRFDDGGASLYGVLDIDTNGGIYQGTGTFASPTTGLKLWSDGGVGRIAGYNATTLQAGFGTDGKLTAGGGNVILSSAGATFVVPAGAAFQETSAVTFKDGSARVHGFVQAYGDASNSGLLLWANDHSARDTSIDIRAQAGATEDAVITLYALRGSGATNYPYIEIASKDAGKYILLDPGSSTDQVEVAGILDVASDLYAASLSTDDGTTKWTLGDYTASVPTVEGYLEVVVNTVTYRIAVERA